MRWCADRGGHHKFNTQRDLESILVPKMMQARKSVINKSFLIKITIIVIY